MNKAAAAKYGPEAIRALPDEMADVVRLTLGNANLAAGEVVDESDPRYGEKVDPADVVSTLPLMGDAKRRALRKPTGLTMDTLGDPLTPQAPYAEALHLDDPIDPEALRARPRLDKVDGETLLRVDFTGHGRAWVEYKEMAHTWDYSRRFTFWLTPAGSEPQSTDGAEQPRFWFISKYHTSDVEFATSVPVPIPAE